MRTLSTRRRSCVLGPAWLCFNSVIAQRGSFKMRAELLYRNCTQKQGTKDPLGPAPGALSTRTPSGSSQGRPLRGLTASSVDRVQPSSEQTWVFTDTKLKHIYTHTHTTHTHIQTLCTHTHTLPQHVRRHSLHMGQSRTSGTEDSPHTNT